MNKSQLRALYKSKRIRLSEVEIQEFSQKILQKLISMPIWEKSVFHVFVPIVQNHEVNTFPIIEYLHEHGKTVLVPKVEGEKMHSCLINADTEWTIGKFNVPEPLECLKTDLPIDVILMPMLVCDLSGNRIGYGGGYYDRFLGDINYPILKLGLNFFPPINQEFEIFTQDVPLDYCVTPEEIVSFST